MASSSRKRADGSRIGGQQGLVPALRDDALGSQVIDFPRLHPKEKIE